MEKLNMNGQRGKIKFRGMPVKEVIESKHYIFYQIKVLQKINYSNFIV